MIVDLWALLPSSISFYSMSKNSQSTASTYTRKPRRRAPMPNRLVRLLSEARWLATAVALLYFVLILLSYNKADPGWSHENAVPHVANLGGRAGAWLADLLLFIFGFSAWWLCVCFARGVWKGYRRLHNRFVTEAPNRTRTPGRDGGPLGRLRPDVRRQRRPRIPAHVHAEGGTAARCPAACWAS
jgi:hypothetical protein